MAEKTKKEDEVLKEDDEEIVVVEVDAKGKPIQQETSNAKAKAKDDKGAQGKDAEDDEDDEDDKDAKDSEEEDARLAESQDDTDAEVVDKRKRRRLKRREAQRRARERQESELRLLREQNIQQGQRLAALEGNTVQQQVATIESQIMGAQREMAQAESIMLKALEAGNHADHMAAMRIRDEAKDAITRLSNMHARAKAAPKTNGATPNPRAASLGREWIAANPWFDPKGGDEESRIARAIDQGLPKDGYTPDTVEYWEELTRRVNERLGGKKDKQNNGKHARDDDDDDEDDDEDSPSTTRRKGPPQGGTRSVVNGRREVRVTPERKQAMIDAGVWDDPVKRNRVLKSYQAYDAENKTAR